MTVFVIRGIVSGGYWDNDAKEFRGILFATHYTENDYWYHLKDAQKEDWCEVIEIYPKIKK